jgi:hypothetical protein
MQWIPIEAVHDAAGNGPGVHGKAAIGCDDVVQEIFATPPYTLIAGAGAQLGQKDDLPEGDGVAGRVSTTWPGPITVGVLRFKDGRYQAGLHHGLAGLEDLLCVLRPLQQISESIVSHARVLWIRLQ